MRLHLLDATSLVIYRDKYVFLSRFDLMKSSFMHISDSIFCFFALCIVQAFLISYLVELKWHWLYQGILKSNKDNNITIVSSVFQFFCVKIMCLISIKKTIIACENKVKFLKVASLWINRFYSKKAEATIICVPFSENFIITGNKYFSKNKCFISFNNYSKI